MVDIIHLEDIRLVLAIFNLGINHKLWIHVVENASCCHGSFSDHKSMGFSGASDDAGIDGCSNAESVSAVDLAVHSFCLVELVDV
jgi:hypothetical protein